MIRQYQKEDEQGVIALWQRVFGDSESFIRFFLDRLPKIGVGAVAEENGIAAMAFALVTEEPKIGYLYAVATAPEYRGRGLAEAVCRKAVELAGAEKVCTLPAEAWLSEWYGRMLHLSQRIGLTDLQVPARQGCAAEKICPKDYAAFREQSRPEAVRFPIEWYEILEALCVSCGGGLYRTGETVLAAYPEDGCCIIRDWAGSDGETAAAVLAGALGMEKARLRLMKKSGELQMLASPGILEEKTWFGLTLD